MTCMRLSILILSIFVLISVSAYSAPRDITILVDTGPFDSVDEGANAENDVNWWDDDDREDVACTTCYAALELKRFLPGCTGVSESAIRFGKPVSLPKSGDVIILGISGGNGLIRSLSPHDSLAVDTTESFRLYAETIGGRSVVYIIGGGRTGLLYGAYALLEELGIGFFGLGETGTVMPSAMTSLPSAMDIVEKPSYTTRGYHAWEDRGNEEFLTWMGRNRMNFWTSADSRYHLCKKLGMKLVNGGHVIQLMYLNPAHEYPYNHLRYTGDESKPSDPYKPGDEYTGDTNGDGVLTYFEAHPEWYGLFDGKRSDNIKDEFGDNYCTSNFDAARELARNMIQSLIDGEWRHVDIINFWMMDGHDHWCRCEECEAQGTYTDRLLDVIHIVSQELRIARAEGRLNRRVELSSLAYLETLSPPTRPLPDNFDYDNVSITYFPIERCYNHTLADPSCIEINQRLADNYLAWASGEGRYYTGVMFIGEYYNVSYLKSMPMVYMRTMADDVPWYYANGSRHFHYMHSPTTLWGTWTLNQRMLATLLWDVTTDSDVFLDDFFSRYYSTTSTITRRWYNNLEKAMESFKAMRYWGWKKSMMSGEGELLPLKHIRLEKTTYLINDGVDISEMVDYITTTQELLDRALLRCTDTRERARLLEDKQRVTYGEHMVRFHYHLFHTAMFDRQNAKDAARAEFTEMAHVAAQLRGIEDLTQVSASHANADNGFEATQAVDVYNHYEKIYGR